MLKENGQQNLLSDSLPNQLSFFTLQPYAELLKSLSISLHKASVSFHKVAQ